MYSSTTTDFMLLVTFQPCKQTEQESSSLIFTVLSFDCKVTSNYSCQIKIAE